jgi:hypothetical protein
MTDGEGKPAVNVVLLTERPIVIVGGAAGDFQVEPGAGVTEFVADDDIAIGEKRIHPVLIRRVNIIVVAFPHRDRNPKRRARKASRSEIATLEILAVGVGRALENGLARRLVRRASEGGDRRESGRKKAQK